MRRNIILILTLISLTPNLIQAAVPLGPDGLPQGPCVVPAPADQLPPETVYTVHGRITQPCELENNDPFNDQLPGLANHAFEIVALIPLSNPCEPPPINVYYKERPVAEDVTDSLGRFSLTIDAQLILPHVPAGERVGKIKFRIRVRYEDSGDLIAQSPFFPPTNPNDYQADLETPGCVSDATRIHVRDENDNSVAGAEVFVNGEPVGTTSTKGEVFVQPRVGTNDEVAARKRIHENATPRDSHDRDSDKNWNYRVYITSIPIRHDAQGNNVTASPYRVPQPDVVLAPTSTTAIQRNLVNDNTAITFGEAAEVLLQIKRTNTLIGLNLRASIEWDATTAEFNEYRDRLVDTSEFLYNATDGQMLIENLEITDRASQWNSTDFRIFANIYQPSNARVGGFFAANGYVNMNPIDAEKIGVFVHEFGHYGLKLRDEYKKGSGWDTSLGENAYCATHGTDDDSEYGAGAPKDACIMRFAAPDSAKKICSDHPDNPHLPGTKQGDRDCWSVLVDTFRDKQNGFPRWTLKTPDTRNAIVGPLPEGAGLPDGRQSYIPVAGWQTTVHFQNSNRPNFCGTLIAQFNADGQPEIGADVTLETTEGRVIYHGQTRENDLGAPNNTPLDPGQLPIKGVHVGDNITIEATRSVKVKIGPVTFATKQTVTADHVVTAEDCAAMFVTLDASFGPINDAVNIPLAAGVNPFDLDVSVAPTPTVGQARVQVTADVDLGEMPIVTYIPAGDGEPVIVPMDFNPKTQVYEGLVADLPPSAVGRIKATATDTAGHPARKTAPVSLAAVQDDGSGEILSRDGIMEVDLLPGAMTPSAQMSVTPADIEQIPPGDLLLAGPYRLDASAAAALAASATVYFNLDRLSNLPDDLVIPDDLKIMQYDQANDQWEELRMTLHADEGMVYADIDDLGPVMLLATDPKPVDQNDDNAPANSPANNDPINPSTPTDVSAAADANNQAAAAATGMCGSGVGLSLSFGLLGLSCISGSTTGRRRRRIQETDM